MKSELSLHRNTVFLTCFCSEGTDCWINRSLNKTSDQLSPGFWEWIPLGTLSWVSRTTLQPRSMNLCMLWCKPHITHGKESLLPFSFIYFTSCLDFWTSEHSSKLPHLFHFHPSPPLICLHPQLTSAPKGCYLNYMEYWVTITDYLLRLERIEPNL